ncbi:hypothetical protein [Crateriforma spongiae]|nr:hypothetical protein [Crateriforma spongiae]
MIVIADGPDVAVALDSVAGKRILNVVNTLGDPRYRLTPRL